MSTPDHPELTANDDSLNGELAYLARFLGDRPGTAPIVLRRLGELGDEARFDLARLRSERAVRLRRLPTPSRRKRAAARVAAVMAFVVTGPSMLVTPAVAQELAQRPSAVVREAAAQSVVLRIVDTGSGKPLAGVKVKTVAEQVVAVTDAGGKATVPAPYAQETVLSLEHEGYPIVLVEGDKLAVRSLVSMRRFADSASLAKGPKAPTRTAATRPAAGRTAADDPAERLMALALEHTRAKPLADAPLLADGSTQPAVASPAEAAVAKVEPPAIKPEPIVAKVEPPAIKPEPVVAQVEPPATPQAAPLTPLERAARAPKRVVKIARADAKAERSVAVAWEAPRDRAEKNIAKVAFADAKAPRAIRVVMRKASPGENLEPASPLGITSDQLSWIPALPTEQVGGTIQNVPDGPEAIALEPTGPATPVEAAAHIAEATKPVEGLPFLIGRSATEDAAPIAEPSFQLDPEALEHPSVHQAPAARPITPAFKQPVAPVSQAVAPVSLPVLPASKPVPAPPMVAAAPHNVNAALNGLLDQTPFKHLAPPKPVPPAIGRLPQAPKPPAHLAEAAAAAAATARAALKATGSIEAPHLISPEEGAKRFATINLPVRPRFAKNAVPERVASAVHAAAEASPMTRVREHLTASRAHMRYAVKAGDMLSSIAQRELGSAALWPVLYQANRDLLTNPRWLQVGLNLKIPRTSTGLAAAGAKTYVVKAGDCLSTIAREHLGDMRKWPQVFAANRHLIKNPWLIFPGQRLVLPVYVATGISESWGDLAATDTPGGNGTHTAGGGSPRSLAD